MTIFLLILKILGLILLIIFGILSIFLAMLFLVPVRYRAQAVCKEDSSPQITGSASYLPPFLKVSFSYRNKTAEAFFRVLFLKKRLNPGKAEESVSKELQTEEKKASKTVSGKGKKKNNPNIFILIPALITELQKEENKEAWKLVLRQIEYLCRHYGPRKIVGNLTFSLSDPSYTGMVLGFVSMFPLIYKTEFRLQPDFQAETVYARGELFLAGRIRLCHVLICFIRLWKNKTIRRLLLKGGHSNVRK